MYVPMICQLVAQAIAVDRAVWFILGRTGFCDSPAMEGLPSAYFTLPDSEGSSAWWKFLLISDTIGVGVFLQLLNGYASQAWRMNEVKLYNINAILDLPACTLQW